MKQWEQLPTLLSVADMAARYGCSPRAINERHNAGKLPRPVDPTARSKQWHPDVVRAFELGQVPAWSPRGDDVRVVLADGGPTKGGS